MHITDAAQSVELGNNAPQEETKKEVSEASAEQNEGGSTSASPQKSTEESKSAQDTPDVKDTENDEPAENVLTRPRLSEKPAEPIESEVRFDEQKRVSFSLRGQSWERVLQWLADASDLSLDWQELPGDSLNLTTTRSYTLEEARDIVNRHLLARGYSMVLNGELLSVMKLSAIKPSLVPRVNAEQLQQLPEHTLCKMSFDLAWLLADESVEEIKPLLSNAGRINKMSRTNRLEIMDTAGSLQDIFNILQEEQSDSGQEQLVKTFPLKHRRASEVIVLLRDLLGVEPPQGSGGGRSPDAGQMSSMMSQMTQQLQQMTQNAASGAKKTNAREPTKTRLVLNQRENMILVQAMPDQMAIVEKAVQQIDVPIEPSNSLLQNINRMRVYRLETVDPQTLVDLLQELGDMSPGTVLKADSNEQAIIAFASLADHLTISSLVERMDQSGRQVEVIPLRRLDAEYVAGTIQALMAPEKEESSNMSGFYRWSPPPTPKKEDRRFKVEPDIENNRLLVFANKVEMKEITLLLRKLGEIPDPSAIDRGMRIFELDASEDRDLLMRRVKELWPRKNRIEYTNPDTESETQVPHSEPAGSVDADDFFQHLRKEPVSAKAAVEDWEPLAGRSGAVRPKQILAVNTSETTGRQPPTTQKSTQQSPVRMGITSEGRLLVTSDDTAALNDMEDLLRELVSPPSSYRVFYMKHATPSWVTLNLKDYFASEAETESGLRYDPFWGLMPSEKKKTGRATLGRRREPVFIPDNFTSTILVRHADRRQLQIIEQLIGIYDVKEPADTRAMRVTRIFRLENSDAEVVADAVKDVFRDLLSANDKALQQKDGPQTQTRVFSYFGNESDEDETDTPIRFKGLLSIGVDEVSNTLIVSSTASLMDTIVELVESLDKAAEESTSVRVLQLDKSVDLDMIQQRLKLTLGSPQPRGVSAGTTKPENPRRGN